MKNHHCVFGPNTRDVVHLVGRTTPVLDVPLESESKSLQRDLEGDVIPVETPTHEVADSRGSHPEWSNLSMIPSRSDDPDLWFWCMVLKLRRLRPCTRQRVRHQREWRGSLRDGHRTRHRDAGGSRDSRSGSRGFPTIGRREPHDNVRDPSQCVEDRATFPDGPLSHCDGDVHILGGQLW